MGVPSARFATALAVLLTSVVAAVVAWPYLAASLTPSARVTAWTHAVMAPIAGRAPDQPPLPGSTVGPDGTILEIVNEQVDSSALRAAESAFSVTRARVISTTERLEALRTADGQRRDLMRRTGPFAPAESGRAAEVEIGQAGLDLGVARAAEREAERDLQAAREAFRLKQKAAAKAPPGAILYSVVVGGAAVEAGDPIARWIDCDDLLVDAPVLEVRLPLIAIGSKALVMLQGEDTWRDAEVIAIHRPSDIVPAGELAFVAKGRDRGAAQVLLKLVARGRDFDRCPVGLAAWVDLPQASLIAVLRARLGLR